MKLRRMVPVLLMCCSALAISGCDQKRIEVPIPIPPERMDCVTITGERPTIPAEYVIDWTKIRTVDQARTEHKAFVTRLRERERPVAGYVVRLEGQLFACADDAAWLRDYTSRLQTP